MEEVLEAISALKNNKAPDIDNIPRELLKAGDNKLPDVVYSLIVDIWKDWHKSIICPIYAYKRRTNWYIRTIGVYPSSVPHLSLIHI